MIQFVAACSTGVRRRPDLAALLTVALFFAEFVQLIFGYLQYFAVHVPLGTAIVVTVVCDDHLVLPPRRPPQPQGALRNEACPDAAFLAVAGGTGAALTLTNCGLDASAVAGRRAPAQPGQAARAVQGAAPHPTGEEADPHRRGRRDYYRVVQQKASLEILPGLKTEVLGYDGLLPGPTFDVRSGRTTVIEQVNQLDVPTAVHLHGGHTPASSDGWPLDLLMPTWRTPRARRPPHHDRWRREDRQPRLHVPEHAAGRHALVPRPPDGLHRPAGLPRPGRASTSSATTRRTRCPARGRSRHPADDRRPRVRRRRLASLTRRSNRTGAGRRAGVHGGRPRRRDPGQRRAVAGARGRRGPLPLPDPQRLQRPPLRARARQRARPTFVQIGSDGGLLAAPVEHETL